MATEKKEMFIPVESPTILDQLDRALDNKDAFLIKLPNKFKETLSSRSAQNTNYTLSSETATIGKVEATTQQSKKSKPKKDDGNPEISFDDVFESENDEASDSRIELLMPLVLPSKTDRSSKEQILFELGLPSLKEIRQNKRRKLNFEKGHEMSFVCVLEDKSQFDNHEGEHGHESKHRQHW